MPAPIGLLIAYPKEVIRAGLRAMLSKSSVRVVAEAEDGPGTLTLAKKHRPDVLLIDANIPGSDCFEVLKKVGKALPDTRFIVLSAIDNPTYMARAKAAGAMNFLLESVTGKDFVAAVENAAAGKRALSSGAFGSVVHSMEGKKNAATSRVKLTPREHEVLSHMAYGLSNDEIARSLEVSIETIKEHVQNILRKLTVSDRTQAAVWAVKSGVI